MAPSRRRVSYVIPPPSDPPPRLQLPPHGVSRNGAIGPLLLSSRNDAEHSDDPPPKWAQHPRHRLGVACLALDTSTQLVGRGSPEGILYSGGRDGLVLSWDLNISMKRRSQKYGISNNAMRRSTGRWEIMTGWADDIIEEDAEEGEEPRSDGDVLGEVKESGRRRRRRRGDQSIPYEQQWETDTDTLEGGKMTQFRQCAQVHSDWVNDILLCNLNQTVVSASSDGTVKAWNPHSASEPTTIGSHADYVRCLTHCREQNWVASGSFDRTIKLWDLANVPTHLQDPLITLHPPDATGPKASVYALATDPYGSIIVSGSPERVIRMWDPRSGKRTGKLVGHTDNIRAILLSDDSKYLLTGSADASIKLWSLSSQRCLHTFTHHTDSVWSLFSSHPSLEIFYSGDRSGIVCKVDVEGCSDISEGECIVLCQENSERSMSSPEGINKIVTMDDNLLWTASGSSSIRRWKVPARRAVRTSQLGGNGGMDSPAVSESPPRSHSTNRRSSEFARSRTPPPSSPFIKGHRKSMTPSFSGSVISESSAYQQDKEGEETWYGIPYESLVKMTSPNETFNAFGLPRGRDPEIATLYSAASVMSVPRMVRSPFQAVFQPNPQGARSISPMPGPLHMEETLHPLRTARTEFEEREVAADAVPLHSVPDDIIHGEYGLVRSVIMNDRIHALTVDTAGEVAVWDIVRCTCLGKYSSEDVAAASFCGSTVSGSTGEKERSPREALETVRERIEGEAVVVSWSTVDTKTGVITVHLNERCFEAEVYADEAGYGPERHFSEEMRINVGKWVLRNLFLNFIKEQQRSRRVRDSVLQDSGHRLQRGSAPIHIDINGHHSPSDSHRRSSPEAARPMGSPKSATIILSPNMLPAVSPSIISTMGASPLLTPMIPISGAVALDSVLLSPIPQSPASNDATPMPRAQHLNTTATDHHQAASSSSARDNDYFSLRTTRRPSVSAGALNSTTPDDFSGWSGPKTSTETSVPQTPNTPSAGSGLMGRLKAFGKGGRRHASEFESAIPDMAPAGADSTTMSGDVHSYSAPKTPAQVLLSGPISPPSSNETPSLPIPPHTSVIISEEASSGWTTLYRGHVSGTGHDARILEEVMPMWLLEYLLTNKIHPVPVTKVSFVLLPYPNKDPNGEQLPELLNTAQAKLTASRFLRVRKLTHHVQDKLDKIASGGRLSTAANTPRSSFEAVRSIRSREGLQGESSRPRPEELFEILCNDMVLPLDMTLAAVRQFVWRQANELTMHYRRKGMVSPPPSLQ